MSRRVSRRDVLRASAASVLAGCARPGEPRYAAPPVSTPELPWGVQSGDVTTNSAVIWCRSDRPARMMVDWALSERFDVVTRIRGPLVSIGGDLIGKVALSGLPGGTRIHYRVRFDDSPWCSGSFGTAPTDARDVLLAWSGDTNGQGWGIDPSRGGMPAYRTLLDRSPDVFVHCGDAIYADGPIPESVALEDGTVWRNLVDPAKVRVAETLADFRGAHLYPRRSAEVRALSAAVPHLGIWDDHEVRDNWFPGEHLTDERYRERSVDALAVPALRAWYDYTPTLRTPRGPMYRKMAWGPLVDVFLLDGRSYRSANEPAPSAFLGDVQAAWLLEALAASKATWKIIACDMPIGVGTWETGTTIARAFDGWANEDPGPPREREIELAGLLSGMRARGVKNVVWVTADVHYAAAHRFDPGRAAFKDFDPFWELIAGPMHATSFPQKATDATFGTEVVWSSANGDRLGSPATGDTSFGLLRIDGRTRTLTVSFVNGHGRDLHRLVLDPR